MKVTVIVIQADIDKAQIDNTYSDPIQVAIERMGYPKAVISCDGASYGTFRMDFPKEAGDKLKAYGLTGQMGPFEFAAEVK